MNKRKYKDKLYEVREIANLKELLNSSAELFKNQAAFLRKNYSGGPYIPVSYAELKNDVNALGTALINLGLKGKRIAVIGENSYEWVVSYLATVCGVGVIVPIDKEIRPKEIGGLLKRAKVEATIYSDKMAGIMREVRKEWPKVKYQINMKPSQQTAKTKILKALLEDEKKELALSKLIEEGKKAIAEGQNEYSQEQIENNKMCAILFTSGTTGMSKGVMLSHNNIARNVMNISKLFNIKENSVGLSVLPMHHSLELTGHVFTALFQGQTVAICEGLKYIQKNMIESKAGVMVAVPLIFETMHKKIFKKAKETGKLETLEKLIALSKKHKWYNYPGIVKNIFKTIQRSTGGHISLFMCGGAAVNPLVVEDFEAMGFPMSQGYGMTECSPVIALNSDRYSKAKSVGIPVPETTVKIVDKDESGMGEIICKSPSVMLGYYE
ncbi:MAG: AMP-binding protein, partial [Anaerovoracaceae bacterium]